jgi:two-component system response regulator
MKDFQHVEILLVEDSVADAEMTQRTLKKRGIANDIAWVKDGVEALEFLFCEGQYANRQPGHPKLVLLDLKMPRMDGLQVLEKMKQDPRTRAIPVVMMTSSREEGDMLNSYQLGVNSYIVKPVSFDEFAETVAQVGMYWMIANQAPA